MSFQPEFPGLFPQSGRSDTSTRLRERQPRPATAKQIEYAKVLAVRTGAELREDQLKDREQLSEWIDAHKPKPAGGRFAQYPSSKQVAFAERIARIKRREIPRACFRDKTMMSRWIDGNKPR